MDKNFAACLHTHVVCLHSVSRTRNRNRKTRNQIFPFNISSLFNFLFSRVCVTSYLDDFIFDEY